MPARTAAPISAAKDMRAIFPPVGTWPRDWMMRLHQIMMCAPQHRQHAEVKLAESLTRQHLLAHEEQQRNRHQAADRHGAEVVEVADHRGLAVDLGIPHRE